MHSILFVRNIGKKMPSPVHKRSLIKLRYCNQFKYAGIQDLKEINTVSIPYWDTVNAGTLFEILIFS
jgi:hypothetical protein